MERSTGCKSVLKFSVLAESINRPDAPTDSPWRLLLGGNVNSTEWMGKEPASCKVIDVQQAAPAPRGKTALIDHAEFLVTVGYKPPGWISPFPGRDDQRYNGWDIEVLDRTAEGVLLDGKGSPLPPGAEPVYLRFTAYVPADFNLYDFGTFLGEE
jgi:hypothetical protein